MKKILLLFLMSLLSIGGINAQRLTGTIGGVLTYEPHDSYFYALEYGVDASVGTLFNEKTYLGVGLGYSNEAETYHESGYSVTGHTNMMPLFAHLTYTNNPMAFTSYYGEAKIGPVFMFNDLGNDCGFYLSVAPIGVSVNKHNKFSLGYRLIHLNDYNANGITLQYNYTF